MRIPAYRRSAGEWDSGFELATRWPSLVSMATDLRETARSLVWEEAGESGATHYHDVSVRQSSRQTNSLTSVSVKMSHTTSPSYTALYIAML